MAIIESCNYVAEIARASPLLLAFGVVNVLLLGLLHFKRKDNRRRDVENPSSVPSTPTKEKSGYLTPSSSNDDEKGILLPGFEALGKVTPLTDFDWQATEQEKIRPFKKVYHMTMALEKTSLNNIAVIDDKYLDRVSERKQMMDLYPSTTIGHLPRAADSINEFWSLMVSYLPTRFPTMFSAGTEPRSLFNKVTGVTLSPDVSDPNEALRAISASLDEDWLVLLRAEDGDGYVLGGHIACFPAGFDISQKIGWRIRDIHGPVPQYKAKLQTSMERFFDRMATGTFVRRCNWSVVTNDKLFTAFSQTHYHEGVEKKGEEVRAEQCYQRTESQTLFRLPGGALVFGIKTYLYNVKDIRDEERAARALARADVTADGGKDTDADGGVQSDFADAIEGLTKGSVPEVFEYKRGPVWKDVVVEYLREPVGLE